MNKKDLQPSNECSNRVWNLRNTVLKKFPAYPVQQYYYRWN